MKSALFLGLFVDPGLVLVEGLSFFLPCTAWNALARRSLFSGWLDLFVCLFVYACIPVCLSVVLQKSNAV